MRPSLIILVMVIVLGLNGAAHSARTISCSAASGKNTVALLELYTSEGCSSCPPADEWLGALPARGFAADRVVALALHVDYWNYLGWEDPFSQKRFTVRQRRFMALNHLRTIYTPQVLLNGRDFRGWTRGRHLTEELTRINGTAARASIRLSLQRTQTDLLEIAGKAHVPKPAHRRNADAYLVIYENNLIRAVHAGENAGRTLHHSFVARQFIGPLPFTSELGVDLAQDLRLPQRWVTDNLGVVAFVQDRHSGDILQALALPVCR